MNRVCFSLALIGASCMGISDRIIAQTVVPDGTLNTIVNPSNNRDFTILNGSASGSNLFHSFREFSIPSGGSATFDLVNTPNISNIFSRVTGNTISNIDGLIKTANSSNSVSLFLLNPNGILFGTNARLDISGSFVGTTADSIRFSDSTSFGSQNPTPLLTMSVPIGLQMGSHPGSIKVQGTGHSLTSLNQFAPYSPTTPTSRLQVQPRQTLALVGGDLLLEGGILTAPGGRIHLGSARAGLVGLNGTPQGLALDYAAISAFQNIQLSQRSLLNVGGPLAGSIEIQGNQVSLRDGSLLWNQNLGNQPGGEITVRAAEKLELIGVSANEQVRSGIISETLGKGTNGNIDISTAGLVVQDGAEVLSRTASSAPGGKVRITATDFIEMRGLSPRKRINNNIGTQTIMLPGATVMSGKAGAVNISTARLSMQNASYISGLSFSDGAGGELVINAETLDLSGGEVGTSAGTFGTAISSVGYRAGNAGNITINTRTGSLRDGALISTTNLNTGNAGNVIVNAIESFMISGDFPASGLPSNVSSTVGVPATSRIRQASYYRASGNAGSVTINTDQLTLEKGGLATVTHYGKGSAGTLAVNAGSILLRDRGGIEAQTANGAGGDIVINAGTVRLLQNSAIATNSNGVGKGGDITISAPIIVGIGNSDIVANAKDARGGNIAIATQGIFGLAYRDLLEPRKVSTNDITASSEFSTNGTVQITPPEVDPNAGLIALSSEIVDPSQQITKGCAVSQNSEFIITGRGGVPLNPLEQSSHMSTWRDVRPLIGSTPVETVQATPTLIEATKWERDRNGKVQLIAEPPMQNRISASCTH